jgi:hypothetical protein
MTTYSPLGSFLAGLLTHVEHGGSGIWMPWLYSFLDNVTSAYKTYDPPPPNHPTNGMVRKQCKVFLKSCRYPGYTKLNAQACKKAIIMTMSSMDNWPPPEVIPPACSVSVD